MFNEILGLIFILFNFAMLLTMYKLFGKTGLFAWVAIASIIANIQVTKTIEVIGLTATLGNSLYASTFLATDILNEKYGKKQAQKAVWLGFSSLLVLVLTMQFGVKFIPGESDFAQGSLETLFGLVPQIAIASMIAYLTSQHLDVIIFSFIKKIFPSDRQFWIRNNGSAVLSQLLDTLIFTGIAFYGVYSLDIWFQIFISTYVLKVIISFMDTPFGYLAKRITPLDEKKESL
ncbi:queuosine precursor transporter [Planomicrobium sp. YIM 101495]|uniref:queuosine precursor transporter n=1 Tax=Planomicrobium sp. YIM 101495 TaxID=2665160 RepID=UPI0012B8C767|nr:queuosine precursor transporter [Planomicrobium sp. YIM 101495]MTD29749.1 queuosine precursor transporter [Planomicrobium sp. YIM 101495]